MDFLPTRYRNRWLDRFFGEPWEVSLLENPWLAEIGEKGYRQPVTDLWETEGEIVITAEMPGISKDDIDITCTENGVVIRVDKREQTEESDEKRGYYKVERSYRGFYRYFPFGKTLDSDKVEATYKEGVLEVHIAKKETKELEKKKVKVN